MTDPFHEIAELAEFIAEENITGTSVNLERIARKNEIGLHFDTFENYFTGMLQHEDNLFDIFINMSVLKHKKNPRTRFTIAHELGHYFIDNHRNLLRKGFSLSYDKSLNYFSNEPVEKEANHFATNLLMPKARFKQDIDKLEFGIDSIKLLSKQYKTSITATVIQYSNLLHIPSFVVFWDTNQSPKSKKFTDLFYVQFKQHCKDFQIDQTLAKYIFEEFNSPFYINDTSSLNSSLSSFFTSIKIESTADYPVSIETMNLQAFGFISLVYLLG